jgi:hypothetical protein
MSIFDKPEIAEIGLKALHAGLGLTTEAAASPA